LVYPFSSQSIDFYFILRGFAPNPIYFFALMQKSKQKKSRLKIKIGQILHQFFSHYQSHFKAISNATFADGFACAIAKKLI
jgi:hypothetical protein